MKKRTVATWIVVGALATGAGVALAETSPPSPAVDPVTTTTTADSATTTTAVPDSTTTTTAPETTSTTAPPETTTTLAPTTTTTAPGGGEGTHPDNHGAEVSKAAHDHSHDAECGNHGHYVSAVAHGQTTCAPAGEKSHGKGDGEGDEPSGD